MRNLSDYSKRKSVKVSPAKIKVSRLCGEIITELVAGVSCLGSVGRLGGWVPAPGLRGGVGGGRYTERPRQARVSQ